MTWGRTASWSSSRCTSPWPTLAAAGLDLSHITNVSFTTVDPTTAGGEYFEDLTFDNKALGTTSVQTRPTVNVAVHQRQREYGSQHGPGRRLPGQAVPDADHHVSLVIGSATCSVGLAMSPLTFQPGQTCQDVEIPVTGSTTPATTASTSFKFAVSDPNNGVLGPDDYGKITVFDPNVAAGVTPAPPVGVQGDPGAEFPGPSRLGILEDRPSRERVPPAVLVTLTGHGYRSGESVAFTLGGTPIGSAIADGDGDVTFTAQVPAGTPGGKNIFYAVGAGSGFTSTVTVNVRGGPGPTKRSLTEPSSPVARGRPATLPPPPPACRFGRSQRRGGSSQRALHPKRPSGVMEVSPLLGFGDWEERLG